MPSAHPARPAKALIAALLWLCSGALPAAVEIEIEGIEESAVRDQLSAWLGAPASDSEADIEAFRRNLPKEGAKALQAVGYYAATLDSRLLRDGDDRELTVEVDLGPPTLLAEPELRIDGPAAAHPAFVELLADPGIRAGQRLDHGAYESLKGRLLDLAQARGFFDAELTTRRIEVEPEKSLATIRLHLASGPRYHIGEIRWDEPPIDADRLQAWLPIRRGEPYRASKIAATHSALLDAGYFQNVRVRVLRDEAKNGEVPLYIQFEPREENEIGLGLGFATDTGARGRVTWTRPHVGRRGHSLTTQFYLSQIGHHVSARYRMPDALAPQTHYDQIEAGSKREMVEDTETTVGSIAFQRVALLDSGWQRTLSLRYESESFQVDEDSETTDLLLPGIAWSRTHREGKLYTRHGRRYSLRLAAGHSDLLSDLDLVESVASGKWLYSFGQRNQLIGRAEIGALDVSDFDRLSTSHRFYAGGDQSVRGFAYKSIGPKDADGDVIGGKYLTTGSIEYVRYFSESLGLALFADAGRAFSDSSEDVRHGAGFGLRWRSPVGPLRIDIGFPIDDDEHNSPRLHLSIGPEL